MQFQTAVTAEFRHHERVVALSEALDIPPLLAALLVLRGQDTVLLARSFLDPNASLLHDPFLLKDMDKGAKRVADAVLNKEKILIYGDYDVDGISSTALLYRFFKSYDIPVLYKLPDRFSEGYGISIKALEELKNEEIDLIVTVDTGSTATNEIAHALSLGYEVVVTDHHECKEELPICTAVINPMRSDCTYPFKGLAGVGVAFKLAEAVERLLHPKIETAEVLERMAKDYFPFVTLGTVADVMPLTDENRYIVQKGLALIPGCDNPGIRSLCTLTNKGKMPDSVTATTVGYILAPRMNAAGRMGSAVRALELLLSDLPVEADVIADELCRYNVCRQREETLIMAEVSALLDTHEFDRDPVLVLSGDCWHQGVIGIVASRVAEQTGKPTILLTFNGDEGKGSGRSIPGVNLVELLTACGDLLIKYGGHDMAVGLSIDRSAIPDFKKAINDVYRATAHPIVSQTITVDAEPLPQELNVSLADALAKLEPCGCGNTAPIFLMRDAVVADVIALSGGKHSKVTVEKDGVRHTVLMFGQSTDTFPVALCGRADLLYSLSVNEYYGRCTIQLLAKGLYPIKDEKEKQLLEALLQKDLDLLSVVVCPPRQAFEAVYRQFVLMVKSGIKRCSVPYKASLLPKKQTVFQYMIACEVFKELGLIFYDYSAKDQILNGLTADLDKHVDLADSQIYRALRKE